MPDWLGFALDAAEWILKHPLPAGEEPTFDTKIASVGKKQIYYSSANMYEDLEMQVDFCQEAKEAKYILQRSGLGASTIVTYYSSETARFSLTWGSSYYILFTSGTSWTASDGRTGSSEMNVRMEAQTVNSLPVTTTSSSTVLTNGNVQIRSGTYAENTFFTNNSTYVSNHTLATKNTFNICNIVAPIYSGTTINVGNINDFRKYGYDIDVNNNVTLDNDALLAYIQNELLPQLELQYRNTYVDFPEPGATYGDDDITYINPFEDDEIDTTGSGGVPALWDGETYILETSSYNVSYPDAVQAPYDALKRSANVPQNYISSANTIISEAFNFIPADLLGIWLTGMLASIVMWFIFRK